MKILSLSNGHGEDAIAIQILQQLQHHPLAPELAALPLVGSGVAYDRAKIPIIGPVKQMPSGGFIYMDSSQVLRDLRGGLLGLTLSQYKTIRNWADRGGKVLAVGDIVPLLFAWQSGAEYAFIGTAKSDYYLRGDDRQWLPQTSQLQRYFGSDYLPWERWLLDRGRCRAVFVRDELTAEILNRKGIKAVFSGNPMMDGLAIEPKPRSLLEDKTLSILLLPGSRMPEALANWHKILEAISGIINSFQDLKLVFLAAIAPGIWIEAFAGPLLLRGWVNTDLNAVNSPIQDRDAVVLTLQNAKLILSQNSYRDCLQLASCAIAMAGTATEQFVGCGKPVITIPGEGPQFTYAFAEAQTRLLGSSVILVSKPDEVADAIATLIQDRNLIEAIWANGKKRMGDPGAAARIANSAIESFAFSTPILG